MKNKNKVEQNQQPPTEIRQNRKSKTKRVTIKKKNFQQQQNLPFLLPFFLSSS